MRSIGERDENIFEHGKGEAIIKVLVGRVPISFSTV
jgi:hypothetical protein